MDEGEHMRNVLKGSGMPMGDIAARLGLTRQGLNYHLRKQVLDGNFKALLAANLPDLFKPRPYPEVASQTTYAAEPQVGYVATRSNAYSVGVIQQNDTDSPFVDLGNGQYIMIVPLVQDYAYAGYLAGYQDEEYIDELPKHSFVVNKQHRGKYMAFQVIGDSMSNGTEESITEGSTVTGREIQRHLWSSRFHIHRFKDYVIVHKEGILIKRIIRHDVDSGVITCQSLNPDKDAYPDFDLNLDDCSQIFNIVNVTQIR
jgi:phage repressor protein C with HTH and peptisase S24 domain